MHAPFMAQARPSWLRLEGACLEQMLEVGRIVYMFVRNAEQTYGDGLVVYHKVLYICFACFD